MRSILHSTDQDDLLGRSITMRPLYAWSLALSFISMFALMPEASQAACTVPNQLTNGQTADASQVMANFNAVTNCVNAAPAGSTNALQYNAGGSTFGAVSPLTDGQVLIGSTGNAPQAAQLAAGPGIAITNAPGSITVSESNSPYTPPKLINFTWANQPSGTTGADASTGLALYQPNQGANNLGLLWDSNALPSGAFTAIIGVEMSVLATKGAATGLAIGDGSGKFISFEFVTNTSIGYGIQADCHWTNYTTYSNGCVDFSVPANAAFVKLNYTGTNFNVSVGSDLNSLVPVASYAANAFIGTPTQIGLYLRGVAGNVGATFFHYYRSDGKP